MRINEPVFLDLFWFMAGIECSGKEQTVGQGCTVTPSARSSILQLFFFIILCSTIQTIRFAEVFEVPKTAARSHSGHYGIICLMVD